MDRIDEPMPQEDEERLARAHDSYIGCDEARLERSQQTPTADCAPPTVQQGAKEGSEDAREGKQGAKESSEDAKGSSEDAKEGKQGAKDAEIWQARLEAVIALSFFASAAKGEENPETCATNNLRVM